MTEIKRRVLKENSIDNSIFKTISKEKMKDVTFKLNAELKREIDIFCAKEGILIKEFFKRASEELLERAGNGN